MHAWAFIKSVVLKFHCVCIQTESSYLNDLQMERISDVFLSETIWSSQTYTVTSTRAELYIPAQRRGHLLEILRHLYPLSCLWSHNSNQNFGSNLHQCLYLANRSFLQTQTTWHYCALWVWISERSNEMVFHMLEIAKGSIRKKHTLVFSTSSRPSGLTIATINISIFDTI